MSAGATSVVSRRRNTETHRTPFSDLERRIRHFALFVTEEGRETFLVIKCRTPRETVHGPRGSRGITVHITTVSKKSVHNLLQIPFYRSRHDIKFRLISDLSRSLSESTCLVEDFNTHNLPGPRRPLTPLNPTSGPTDPRLEGEGVPWRQKKRVRGTI